MIWFRLRDYLSVLIWRLAAPLFGSLGRGARIVRPLRIIGARFCHFGANSTLQFGAYVIVTPELQQDPILRIGARTTIGNHAHIVVTRRVEMGEAVLIADRVFIADNGHEYRDPLRPVLEQGLRQLNEVTIGDGTWIGENAVIVGCRIGRNCVIGANSVVTRDMPDHCVVAGSPARIVKRYCAKEGAWRRTDEQGRFIA